MVSKKSAGRRKGEKETPWTMSVPQAGRHFFDLGKNASYDAVKRGIIPVVKVGGKLRALSRVLEQRLAKDPIDE
jgi:hypothetical protein